MKANIYRTHNTSGVTKADAGKKVRVAGFVNTIRNHGGITFIDLRDHFGCVQLVMKDAKIVETLTKETVISVYGEVVLRDKNNINAKIPSGEIEIVSESVEILNACRNTLPFDIEDSKDVNEEMRLKHRYLDLRNPIVHKNIVFRAELMTHIRNKMAGMGFTEIHTPILTASSPEGARDYIVPSRNHKGKFYALPQAPQQFKQLLMASGFDKYFQIAPCFRDEDARADRSPGEFYQIDLEMAFATQDDVFAVIEELMTDVFSKYGKYKSDSAPFIRIPFSEAMEKYGSDKPDLRNPLIIHNLTKIFENTAFNGFKNSTVKGICVKTGEKPRSFYDSLTEYIIQEGAKGLAWLKVDENKTLNGPVAKFFSEEEAKLVIEEFNAMPGDAIFIIAGAYDISTKMMGKLRLELGRRLDICEKDTYRFCWIVDFPMYETDEEEGGLKFCHNPFTMPQGGMEALETKNPLDILAYQYDIVVNGIELSSGGVRNHNPEIMLKAFSILGHGEDVVKNKFGALYNAFNFGAPPHAGIAPGFDRLVMVLLDEPNIREVIAFPMNKRAQDILMNAPCEVTEKQLREVHIKIRD